MHAAAAARRSNFSVSRVAAWTLGVAVGLVLVIAALLKASSPAPTLSALSFAFEREAAAVLLRALVLSEVLLGAWLISGARPTLAFAVASALFVAFLGWIGYLALLDAPVGCGCGFQSEHWLLGDHRGAGLLRSGLLLTACLVGAGLSRFQDTLAHTERTPCATG